MIDDGFDFKNFALLDGLDSVLDLKEYFSDLKPNHEPQHTVHVPLGRMQSLLSSLAYPLQIEGTLDELLKAGLHPKPGNLVVKGPNYQTGFGHNMSKSTLTIPSKRMW